MIGVAGVSPASQWQPSWDVMWRGSVTLPPLVSTRWWVGGGGECTGKVCVYVGVWRGSGFLPMILCSLDFSYPNMLGPMGVWITEIFR